MGMLLLTGRHKTMYTNRNEQGNAVTLTLLGLSVAILAGMVVLYYVGREAPEQIYMQPEVVEDSVAPSENVDAENKNLSEGWNTYVSEDFDFEMKYPDGWVVATGTLSTGDPVVTFTQATQAVSTSSLVYSHQDVASHVSVYPYGVATEGIASDLEPSSVVLPLPYAFAQDYILTSSRPWATKVTFSEYPDSWSESGFVFARMLVEEEQLMYMRGSEQIEQYEFDPMTGDHIERAGFIDTNAREVEENILLSFRFLNMENGEQQAGRSIMLEEPLPEAIVTSPQTVRGTIPGDWYFGEEYPIVLQTDDGKVLAELFVAGLNEWDTQANIIPFEVSLVFEETSATSGVLMVGTDVGEGEKLIVPVQFDN